MSMEYERLRLSEQKIQGLIAAAGALAEAEKRGIDSYECVHLNGEKARLLTELEVLFVDVPTTFRYQITHASQITVLGFVHKFTSWDGSIVIEDPSEDPSGTTTFLQLQKLSLECFHPSKVFVSSGGRLKSLESMGYSGEKESSCPDSTTLSDLIDGNPTKVSDLINNKFDMVTQEIISSINNLFEYLGRYQETNNSNFQNLENLLKTIRNILTKPSIDKHPEVSKVLSLMDSLAVSKQQYEILTQLGAFGDLIKNNASSAYHQFKKEKEQELLPAIKINKQAEIELCYTFGKEFSELKSVFEVDKVEVTLKVSKLISQKTIEDAFTSALQCHDADTLSSLCSMVDLQQLLAVTPPKLSQEILQALLVQLSRDLSNDTPTKLIWMKIIASLIVPEEIDVSARTDLEEVHRILQEHQNSPQSSTTMMDLLIMIRLVSYLLPHK